ncbi:MAG: PQQ-binding-like beta-propeller repeat protein [Planctomycetota bacterium]
MFLLVGLVLNVCPADAHDLQANIDSKGEDNRTRQVRDWPRYLGTNFDGSTDALQTVDADSFAAMKCRWHLTGSTSYGMGSVANGRYLHFDRVGNQERIAAYAMDDGRQLWQNTQPVEYRDPYGYDDGPRSSPTIDGNDVFTFGVAGRLSCHDLESGALRWSVETNREYGVVTNFFGVGCSPLVMGESVLVMVGGSKKGMDETRGAGDIANLPTNGSALVAFDRKTGKEKWRCGEDLASYSSPRPVSDQRVLVFCRNALLLIATGENVKPDQRVLWSFPWRARKLESVNAMVPIVDRNQVFISECYSPGSALLDLTSDKPDVIWQDEARSRDRAFRSHWATPNLVRIDGQRYLIGGSGRNAPDSSFLCMRLKDGKTMWEDFNRTRSSSIRIGDRILRLTEDGELALIRPDIQRLVIESKIDLSIAGKDRPALKRYCWAAPIYADGCLLVRGKRNVLCLQLP